LGYLYIDNGAYKKDSEVRTTNMITSCLPSCTHPPRAPVTPLAVRYYSTELASDTEEEEEEEVFVYGFV